jgi:hypothetical protein
MKFNIVVASDKNLKDFVNPCINSIKDNGYDPMIYDLGGLGIGKAFNGSTSQQALHKFPKKPFVIKDALERLPKNQWLAWIDIDCIMKAPIDDAISLDYDVGVTFRKNHLNSGVTFWQHTSNSLNFLDLWGETALKVDGDQNALNKICNITLGSSINQIYKIKETKVKIFDAKIYNNFFFIKNQDDAKILHYKSKHRNRFPFKS